MSCQDPQNLMGYSDMNAQNMPGQIMPAQTMPGKNMPGQSMPEQSMPGQDILGHVLSHSFTAGQPSTPAQVGGMQMQGPYGGTAGAVSQQPAPGSILSQFMPITPTTEPPAMNVNNLQYLNAALRTQIGRKVTIDFLIGTNTLVDKTGTLLAVGANYLIINEIETDDLLFCDFFTIKFVRVYG